MVVPTATRGNQPPLSPPFVQGWEAVHRPDVTLTFRSAGERIKNADLEVGTTESGEQSENVYENKGWLR